MHNLPQNRLNDVFASYLNAQASKDVEKQFIQDKPMWQGFNTHNHTFAGGKGYIEQAVSSGYGGIPTQGYSGEETVGYTTPTGILRASFPWQEFWTGAKLSHTELKMAGFQVTEPADVEQKVSRIPGDKKHELLNMVKEKAEMLDNDHAKNFDDMLHRDGTQSPRALIGIQAFIKDNPAEGTTGGLDRATLAFWRNRAATAAANTAGTGLAPIAVGGVIQFYQRELRQLRRYVPNRRKLIGYLGGEHYEAFEKEMRELGILTQSGFGGQKVNLGIRGFHYDGLEFVWDPTLDDMGLSKRAYVIDHDAIFLDYLGGYKKKLVTPPRPSNQFVQLNGYADTLGVVAKRLNSSGVYDIA